MDPHFMLMAAALRSPAAEPQLPPHQRRLYTEPDYYWFECPHCGGTVQVMKNEVNCTIFRHGTYRTTGAQMNPHTPEPECTRLAANHEINGCGKPFRVLVNQNVAEICGYI